MKVGVLGGGQLGRMLALAGIPLGIRCRFLDPSTDAPAKDVGELVAGGYEDEGALRRLVEDVDVVTYEFENVPPVAVRFAAEHVPIHPGPQALEIASDRLQEKRFFRELGIATAPFAPASSLEEIHSAVESIALPAILKTRRLGYDGKGQRVLRKAVELEPAWRELGGSSLLLEGVVEFDRELSIIATRGVDGEMVFYPLIENHHRDGILRLSIAPAAGVASALVRRAEEIAAASLEALEYVGVLAIELFQVGEELLANEMAPRVHNSGHWTIEGAATSQFENHLRAILGWPLGATEAVGHSAMINLVGDLPAVRDVIALPWTHLHLYGKDPRAGRKLGHVTVRADSRDSLDTTLAALGKVVRSLVSDS